MFLTRSFVFRTRSFVFRSSSFMFRSSSFMFRTRSFMFIPSRFLALPGNVVLKGSAFITNSRGIASKNAFPAGGWERESEFLPITHSPFPIPHSPFPITHSPLPIPHSPFPIPHSLTSGKICKVSISFSNGIDLRKNRN